MATNNRYLINSTFIFCTKKGGQVMKPPTFDLANIGINYILLSLPRSLMVSRTLDLN